MAIDSTVHRTLAIEANNSTWEFLGESISELTVENMEEMTRRAYAAAYHWARAEGTTPVNTVRAEWLLSRVWSARSEGALALQHAQRAVWGCKENGIADFDLAYALEASARAHACLGDRDAAKQFLEESIAVTIADPQDRAQVESDLTSEPWFGMR